MRLSLAPIAQVAIPVAGFDPPGTAVQTEMIRNNPTTCRMGQYHWDVCWRFHASARYIPFEHLPGYNCMHILA